MKSTLFVMGGLFLAFPVFAETEPPQADAPPVLGSDSGETDAGELKGSPIADGAGNSPYAPYSAGASDSGFTGDRKPGITGPGTDEPTGPNAALYARHEQDYDYAIHVNSGLIQSQAAGLRLENGEVITAPVQEPLQATQPE